MTPRNLYEFQVSPEGSAPGVLLVGVEGFMDAGSTIRLLSSHLIDTCHAELIVSFDIDQLIDYRGRRPAMVFDTDRYESFDKPHLSLYRLTDREGRAFYLLNGLEPDFQWGRVIDSLRHIMRTLGVTSTIMWHGIPMGVPHTRPTAFTAHATDQSLLTGNPSVFGRVQIPGSFAGLLQLRLGEAGQKAMGFSVHVPHYLADSEYPDAALTALNAIGDAAGLNLPNDALVSAVSDSRAQIASAIGQTPEIAQLISRMEEQFDEVTRNPDAKGLLQSTDRSEMSADELGAEVERFLREMGGPQPD